MFSLEKRLKRSLHDLWSMGAEVAPILRYRVTPEAAGNTVVSSATSFLATGITSFVQPDVPRALTVTGSGGSVGGSVHINGKDILGKSIHETIAVTTANTQITSQAYRHINDISFPTGTGGSVAIGYSSKLGLPAILDADTIMGVMSGSAQDTYTLSIDEDEVAKNLITPNTAADGTNPFQIMFVPK